MEQPNTKKRRVDEIIHVPPQQEQQFSHVKINPFIIICCTTKYMIGNIIRIYRENIGNATANELDSFKLMHAISQFLDLIKLPRYYGTIIRKATSEDAYSDIVQQLTTQTLKNKELKIDDHCLRLLQAICEFACMCINNLLIDKGSPLFGEIINEIQKDVDSALIEIANKIMEKPF